MSDITSTIRIDDGFTQPLQDLTKAAIAASDKVDALKDSLEGLANVDLDEFGDYFDAALLLQQKRFDKLTKRISKSATETANKIAKQVRQTTNNIRFEVLYVTSFVENKVEQFSKKAMFSIKWKLFYLTDLFRNKITEAKSIAKKLISKEGLSKLAESLGLAIGKVWGGITNLNKLITVLFHNIKKGVTDAILRIPDAIKKVSSQTTVLSSSIKKGFLVGMAKIPEMIKNISSKSTTEIVRLKKELLTAKDIFYKGLKESKLAGIINGEINGYQKYRNIIWDKQDALKNAPQQLNMADKIGRRGNILARRLEVAGFDKTAKFLYGKSDALIGKYGVKPQTIADPTVMGYIQKRAAEIKGSITAKSKEGIVKGVEWLKGTEVYKITKDVALDFGKMVGLSILTNMAFSALDKFRDKLIDLVQSTRNAILNSLEEVSTKDKLKAIYGSEGVGAHNRAYELANELGESSGMVSQLSQSALSAGIDTNSFERIMRLSDKVGKLKLGSSTQDVASELISNIYNRGDIESLSGLFGLDKTLTESLEKSDFKKLLEKGDLSAALDIAEKVADQAGFTDDKYKKASDSLSQNYKKIENMISNVKRRLSEIYVETLEPAVKKFEEFLESDEVQVFIRILERGARRVGSFVSNLLITIMDNLGIIAAIIGFTMVGKLYLVFRSVQGTLALIPMIKGALTWILTRLGFNGIAGAIQNITVKTALATAKATALSALKIAGPFVAAGAALGGILYAIYDCTAATDELGNKTQTFSEWLNGALIASYAGAVTIFHNVFVFFERIGAYIVDTFSIATAALEDFDIYMKKLKGEKIRPKIYIDKKQYESMSKDAKKALGKVYVETSSVAGVNGGHGVQEKLFYYGKEEVEQKSKLDGVLEGIRANQTQYLNVEKEVQKVIDSGVNSLAEYMKGLLGLQGKKQDGVTKKLDKIGDDTHHISSSMSQEDELDWMKEFSNRQIMSNYGNTTTINNRTINQNGVSQNVMAETYRRDRSTIPARSR